MTIRWQAEAVKEAEAAADFYREKQPGLEQRFLEVLEDALRRIQRRPQIYQAIEEDIRKCKLPRFPYGIIFRVKRAHIEIIAIMHLRRQPGYWQTRMQSN
jgi:plasmid stabilization system protein ParE